MASTYLQRTPGSAGNRRKWTFSCWLKRSNLVPGGDQQIMSATNGSNTVDEFKFQNDKLKWVVFNGSSNVVTLRTTRVFRDISAWYHIVLQADTENATSTNRWKLYVNGEQVSFDDETDFGSQNLDAHTNAANVHRIGTDARSPANHMDGCFAHIHFTDGSLYDASVFGETDSTTGIWKPKLSPSVTYGTNGYFLKFASSGSMGTDSSGNANNFTVNGTMTQTIDTPSNFFATLNPLDNFYCAGTFSNGNNTIVTGSSEYSYVRGTLGVSQGKWYYEAKAVATSSANTWYSIGWSGNSPNGTTTPLGNQSDAVAYQGQNGTIRINTVETSTGTTFTTGDIIGTALDLDNNLVYFYKNGTLVNSGGTSITASASTTNGIWCPAVGDFDGTGTKTWSANFGNGYFGTTPVASAQNPDDGIGIFEYTVPTGYKALCTKSINAQEYS